MRQILRPLAAVLVAAVAALAPEALMADATALDRPAIAARLFHARPEPDPARAGRDRFAAAPDGTRLHVREHISDASFPTLLLFHGNGEIASDYDDLAPLLAGLSLNLVVAEFRGYGLSEGEPTASKLASDADMAFGFVLARLKEDGASPRLIVMGRSLGSACALALAASHPGEVDGLVVESGFAGTLALLRVLGLDARAYGLTEADGFGNLEHVRGYAGPTLFIHGARDDLIAPAEAKALFAVSPAAEKTLLLIPGAGHNDLFFVGRERYLDALARLAAQAAGAGKN